MNTREMRKAFIVFCKQISNHTLQIYMLHSLLRDACRILLKYTVGGEEMVICCIGVFWNGDQFTKKPIQAWIM